MDGTWLESDFPSNLRWIVLVEKNVILIISTGRKNNPMVSVYPEESEMLQIFTCFLNA